MTSNDGASIKVEPLSPHAFQQNSFNMRVDQDSSVNREDAGEFADSLENKSQPETHSNTLAYQSASMPVFPNMPYPSTYSYMAENHLSTNENNIQYNHVEEPDAATDSFSYGKKPPVVGKKSHLPKRYKCAMCAYRTRYKSDLNRHVRKHAIATFNCDICNMPFKTVGNVEFHKRKEHAHLIQKQPPKELMKHMCEMCTYGTMYSSDLTRHVRKHYVAKFHCTICNKPFMTSGSLVQHKRSEHDMQDVEVVMGLEGIESVNQTGEEIQSDVSDEKGDVNGNIDAPDKHLSIKSISDESLRKTGNGQTRKENMQDGICNDSSRQEYLDDSEPPDGYIYEDPDFEPPPTMVQNGMDSVLVRSEEIERKPFMTRMHGFERKPYLSEMDERKSGNESGKHTCPYCEKSFGRKLVLDYHLKNIHRIFSENEPSGDYVEYPDDYDLALDISIQELERSHSADSSKSATPTNGPLRHKCPYCAYATNYKSTYDRHVRKHEVACHICNVCRMPFITFGHLQRHIRDNHPDHNQQISQKEITVEKHKCPYCNFEAETLPQLCMHSETVHNRKMVQEIQRPNSALQKSPSKLCNDDGEKLDSCNASHTSSISCNDSLGKQHTSPSMNASHSWTVEDGVSNQIPTSGRYAKLVSNFDDFAEKPYACSLCFYRTNDISQLVKHAENHLTGCNPQSVPETARFSMDTVKRSHNALGVTDKWEPKTKTNANDSEGFTPMKIKTEPTTVQPKKRILTNSPQTMSRAQQRKQFSFMKSKDTTSIDRIIPTFSVHYRKDKSNVVRPYLCLLCRKRFRHLAILKQHFAQVHNETTQVTNQVFECKQCCKIFNSPMALQEHHEMEHGMS